MVVIAIMATLSVFAFFGTQSFNQGQAVKNAQNKLLSDLRGVQAKVNSGDAGLASQIVRAPAGATYYTVNGVQINLPSGVVFQGPVASVCFLNANYFAEDPNKALPASCTSFAGTFTVKSTSNNVTKAVIVEGSGNRVTRIYAQ